VLYIYPCYCLHSLPLLPTLPPTISYCLHSPHYCLHSLHYCIHALPLLPTAYTSFTTACTAPPPYFSLPRANGKIGNSTMVSFQKIGRMPFLSPLELNLAGRGPNFESLQLVQLPLNLLNTYHTSSGKI
jgi:hypothetical protein